jgi:hypothetical protein
LHLAQAIERFGVLRLPFLLDMKSIFSLYLGRIEQSAAWNLREQRMPGFIGKRYCARFAVD